MNTYLRPSRPRTRFARLSIHLAIFILSVLYLGGALGILTVPIPAIAEIPWHRLTTSSGFGKLKIRYLDGVAYVDDLGKTGRHPIEEMVERGRAKAEALERKKAGVKTLVDAVHDYRDAYGMEPPEGFDEWYTLAVGLDAPAVPSLYPLAQSSILPFLALPAPLLRQRVRELVHKRGVFGIEYKPEAEKPEERIQPAYIWDGITTFKTLHEEWVQLSRDDAEYLPPSQNPDEPMMLAVWVDDVSHHPPSAKILGRSRELAKAGKVWDEEELLVLEAEEGTKQGWGPACDPELNRHIGQDALWMVNQTNEQQSSFIDEPMVYADPCRHPEHLRQNGELLMKEEWTIRGLLPLASLNSPIGGGEIIGPTTVERNRLASHTPWSSKTESRLWWRGNPNSAFFYDKWDWRASQRFRLSDYASGRREHAADVKSGVRTAEDKASPVLLDVDDRVRREWKERDVLRATYLDISLVASKRAWPCGAHFSPFFYCDNDDGVRRPNCPQYDQCFAVLDAEYDFAPNSDTAYDIKHKYRLDVDGFGWTTRWREELSKNNVVIKVTLYPEWWTPQAIPWYHYIPGRYDFADLYDIMAYFTGTPEDHTGEITPERRTVLDERDRVAEEIAARGREFAINRLRYEDMRVYMFLLLLEYRRAWSDDRVAATFRLD